VYARPRSIEEAVAAMATPGAVALCGGTDLLVADAARPDARSIVDLTAVAGLRGISAGAAAIRIGAAVTWTEIAAARLPSAFDGLKAAAREIGSIQIQNRGTIAGNLCNASPAADGIPPLLTLDARVELRSRAGSREVPLSSFIIGYRKTALQPGEIVSAVIVPAPSPAARSAFVKLGARRYLVISIVMAAAVIEKDEAGAIARATIAVGAASPVARRLPALERALAGLASGIAPSSMLADEHFAPLSPIDDVRATAAYRLEAARAVVAEALDRAAGVSSGG
jgi:CO/xanthine dehydrogenase FAD-binding subunit